jgi:hypothetical protein
MSPTWLDVWLDSREFYDLMQAYRHAPLAPQSAVVLACEAVKTRVREVARESEQKGKPC